ncbi:MAG: glycosyltransferase [Elusimicrobia bacterium]|nr:glycosyltransferase [Elusimicrobiota bacterium]
MPKVSIIVPVYNVEKYLPQCLDSILKQTFTDFECICVNDGSPDNSLAILQEYAKKDDRIKIISQENKGLAGARNTGFKYVQSPYVAFVDSDDWIEKNYLQILYETIEKTNSEIVICNYEEYYEDENKFVPNILPQERKISNNDNLASKISKGYAQPTVWTKIIKMKLLKENDIHFFEGFNNEDSPFTSLVFLLSGKIAYVDNILYFYRIRNNSIMSKKHKVFRDKVFNFMNLIENIIDRQMFNDDIFKLTYKLLFWDLSGFNKKIYDDNVRQSVLNRALNFTKKIIDNKKYISNKNLLKIKMFNRMLKVFRIKSFVLIRILKNFIF